MLERLGLAHAVNARPGELSGGEQQRAAIARALVARPDVVLADEPTGALDSVAAQRVIELLGDASARGQTIVMVTHDSRFARHAGRTVHLFDGRVAETKLASPDHDESMAQDPGRGSIVSAYSHTEVCP